MPRINNKNWKYMDGAPRSALVSIDRSNGKSLTFVEKAWILGVNADGEEGLTYWMPDQERWCGYCKGDQPLGWKATVQEQHG